MSLQRNGDDWPIVALILGVLACVTVMVLSGHDEALLALVIIVMLLFI